MSLASPVWKNFLFPPWSTDIDTLEDNGKGRERKREQIEMQPVEELDFTEDNAVALYWLLEIAHLRP